VKYALHICIDVRYALIICALTINNENNKKEDDKNKDKN
jgi:hypothetical protein